MNPNVSASSLSAFWLAVAARWSADSGTARRSQSSASDGTPARRRRAWSARGLGAGADRARMPPSPKAKEASAEAGPARPLVVPFCERGGDAPSALAWRFEATKPPAMPMASRARARRVRARAKPCAHLRLRIAPTSTTISTNRGRSAAVAARAGGRVRRRHAGWENLAAACCKVSTPVPVRCAAGHYARSSLLASPATSSGPGSSVDRCQEVSVLELTSDEAMAMRGLRGPARRREGKELAWKPGRTA